MLTAGMFPEKIEKAFFAAIQRFQHRPEVTGIDVGYRIAGGEHEKTLCIRIHVKEKHAPKLLGPKEKIPKTILGVPTDVIQGTYRKHEAGASQLPGRTAHHPRILPGISIGHVRATAGTFGAVVRANDTGRECILSASHVLYPDAQCAPGDPIVQPGPFDGGSIPNGVVASLMRADFQTDTAIAELQGNRPFDHALYGTGVRLQGSRFPAIGNRLRKSGRTTEVTEAWVDGIGAYNGLAYCMRLVPPRGQAGQAICEGGDSGAVWYDPDTNQGVGVHLIGDIANSRYHSAAIASSLHKALEFLRAAL